LNINFSRIQFFLLLFVAQTGTVVLTYQSLLINVAGRDAWLVFLVAGMLHYVMLLLYERFNMRFNVGPLVGWLYKGYWLLVTVAFIVNIDYVLAVWGFPETPQVIVIVIIVGISLYANLSRPETVINLSVILIPLIIIFIAFLTFAWKDLVWTNIFPLGEAGGKEWFNGLLKAQLAFVGIELYLFFRRHVDIKERIKGFPLFVFQMTWLLFFFFTVILTLLFFTLSGLKMIPEPLLYILKSQEVTFVERLDLFFLYIWMIWSIITVAIFSFSAMYVHRLHAKENKKRDIIIWHVLLVVLPLSFVQKQYVVKIDDVLIYAHLLFAIIIPAIVIITNRRKEK